VLIRCSTLSWARRYPLLVTPNPRAQKEGIAGYELALDFNGLPFYVVPRTASEMSGKASFQLLSVNEAEQKKNPCRRLVTRRGAHWELTGQGTQLLDLLKY